jgi:gluconolactonase
MGTAITAEVVREHAAGKGLLEAPCYDAARGMLFSDARQGGVHCLAQDGTVETVWAHRKGIGGMALHGDGGLVVSGRNVAYRRDQASPTVALLDQDPAVLRNGFNDLTVDATGRVYVGSVGEVAMDSATGGDRIPGGVYVIDTDGSAREVASGISMVNGMGFSPDGTRLYVSDSMRPAVLAFDVDPDTGDLGEPAVFAAFEEGAPDGMAISDDGLVWIALAFTGKVVAYAPDGALAATLAVPDRWVTSVAFGGPDLRTLYVTTAAHGEDDLADAALYSAEVPHRGLPVPLARTRAGSS